MIVADILWISLSKQSGHKSTELNSIRLKDFLVQLEQFSIALSQVMREKAVFVNYGVVRLQMCLRRQKSPFDGLSVVRTYRLQCIFHGAYGKNDVACDSVHPAQGCCDGQHRRSLFPVLPAQVRIDNDSDIAQLFRNHASRSCRRHDFVPRCQVSWMILGRIFTIAR